VLLMKEVLSKLDATVLKEEKGDEYTVLEFSLNDTQYDRITMKVYPNKIVLETPVVYIENPNSSKKLFEKHKGNFEEIKEGKEYRYGKTLPRDTHQLKGYIKKIVKMSCIVGLNYELRYYNEYKADKAVELLKKYNYPIEFG
ncbi:MAG: hypothetical protein U9N35_04165, partial [Euryarchaeota archaeon]|nr:hypothetical protein [Euryarchaeota archaeon]